MKFPIYFYLFFSMFSCVTLSSKKYLSPISMQDLHAKMVEFNISESTNRVMDYSSLLEYSAKNGGVNLTFMGASFVDEKANILNTTIGDCNTANLAKVENLNELKIDTTMKSINTMNFNLKMYPTLFQDITSFSGITILVFWNTKLSKELFESKKQFAIEQSKRVKTGYNTQILFLNTNVVPPDN